ncbi:hypothetical protein UFOVP121_75 [uncultured Caudovirales phage]|uniref:Uncharacterized protein n=1 Tax=uncultured Caudovirales phage TaxID=2100421 RepID=A0A6J5LCS4_9CAUD|nr:hypothetical protein UFOVP121_75 [uncultured Caudovirales phage]CAB4135114.1 hypothetical protein UFOVP277_80 [uncultured Caudovirales phage]
MKRSEALSSQIGTKRYHLTQNLSPSARAYVERTIAKLEQELAIELAKEAAPDYKEPEWQMPAWGTYGT